MEKVNVWFVVIPHEDNRPGLEWFLEEKNADDRAEACMEMEGGGEPIVCMVETFIGSNIHQIAQ